MFQKLRKTIAIIKRTFIECPKKGIWMPPPMDCVLIFFTEDRKPTKELELFHDPFKCNGNCLLGWKYGYFRRK